MSVSRKMIRNIIIAVVVLAFLGCAYFWVLKWNPDNQENRVVSENTEIFNIKAENIAGVVFKNTSGQFTFKKTGEGEVAKWCIPERADIEFSPEKIRTGVLAFTKIYAVREIEKNIENLKDFGLDEEKISVTILGADGTECTLMLGNSVLVDDTFYLMKKGDNTVYTVSKRTAQNMLKTPNDFRETNLGSINITDMDEFILSKGGKKVLALKRNSNTTNSSEFATSDMMMSYPYEEQVRINLFEEMFAPFATEIKVVEFVSDDINTMTKYGIDKGYRIDVRMGETVNTLALGDVTEDGYVYAVYNDNRFIFTVDGMDMLNAVKDVKPFDLVQKFAHIYSIDTVESIEVSANGKTHILLIERNQNSKDEKKIYGINGKNLSEDAFKKLFQSIIGLSFTDTVDDESRAGKSVCEINFKLTDGTVKKAIYREYDERNLMVIGNDGKKYLILKKYVMSMLEMVETANAGNYIK